MEIVPMPDAGERYFPGLSQEELHDFLHLHDKHIAAYKQKNGIPHRVRCAFLADAEQMRAEILHDLLLM